MSASATTLTPEQQQLLAVAQTLQSQERAQIRLSLAGVLGLGLLGAAVYFIRGRR
jgi:hypothetical protein